LAVKFPTKGIYPPIVIEGFTIIKKEYLVKGNKIRKGDERNE